MVGEVNNPTTNHLFILLLYIREWGSYWQNIYGYAVNDYSVRATVFLWTQKRLGIYQFPWFT